MNKLFFYYNPLEDSTLWNNLFIPSKKLKMITLNNCKLRDENVSQFLKTMVQDPEDKHNSLIYIDFTGNNLTNEGNFYIENSI